MFYIYVLYPESQLGLDSASKISKLLD